MFFSPSGRLVGCPDERGDASEMRPRGSLAKWAWGWATTVLHPTRSAFKSNPPRVVLLGVARVVKRRLFTGDGHGPLEAVRPWWKTTPKLLRAWKEGAPTFLVFFSKLLRSLALDVLGTSGLSDPGPIWSRSAEPGACRHAVCSACRQLDLRQVVPDIGHDIGCSCMATHG